MSDIPAKTELSIHMSKTMKKRNRKFRSGLLLSMALILSSTPFVSAQEVKKTPSPAKVFHLRTDGVTAMIASSGALSGNAKRHFRSANVVHGFSSPQDTVTWTVIAPKYDDPIVNSKQPKILVQHPS